MLWPKSNYFLFLLTIIENNAILVIDGGDNNGLSILVKILS